MRAGCLAFNMFNIAESRPRQVLPAEENSPDQVCCKAWPCFQHLYTRDQHRWKTNETIAKGSSVIGFILGTSSIVRALVNWLHSWGAAHRLHFWGAATRKTASTWQVNVFFRPAW